MFGLSPGTVSAQLLSKQVIFSPAWSCKNLYQYYKSRVLRLNVEEGLYYKIIIIIGPVTCLYDYNIRTHRQRWQHSNRS